jgi:hypothetical protein
MAGSGRKRAHTSGRSGRPNNMHKLPALNCAQRTPAGLPCGMPGMGLLIDGAMQQAAQRGRQSMRVRCFSLHDSRSPRERPFG